MADRIFSQWLQDFVHGVATRRQAQRRDRSYRGAKARSLHFESLEARRVLAGNPLVLSIERASPVGPGTDADTVSYLVTFSEDVTGVDPTDFSLALTGTVSASTPVAVTPVNASQYTATIH